MGLPALIIDTDILSAIMKNNRNAITRAAAYLSEYPKLNLSVITQYEILRGLKAKNANRQIQAFTGFCHENIIVPVTDEIAHRASDLYAELTRKGAIIGDADILIAATAMVNRMGLATNNESHFNRIDGLRLDNWLTPSPG